MAGSDVSLLAVGGRFTDSELEALAWESADGRSWDLAETAGPTIVTSWHGKPVGFSQGPDGARFWVWSEG